MTRKRFKWTRAKYRRADHLARLLGRQITVVGEEPDLVRRYFELWARHPQHNDPLLQPLRYRVGLDDIPF